MEAEKRIDTDTSPSATPGLLFSAELHVTTGILPSDQLGYSILPFTQGFNGTYLPNAAQGWAYTLYNYADPAHKHAVTSLQSGETYSYDANGNMITRVEGGVTYTQNFDIENRLASVTVGGQTTTFVYDGDGNLVKKLKPDGTSTVYIGGVYEVDLNTGGAATKKTSYYPAGGATRTWRWGRCAG
jgi:YD repeat-containing protein